MVTNPLQLHQDMQDTDEVSTFEGFLGSTKKIIQKDIDLCAAFMEMSLNQQGENEQCSMLCKSLTTSLDFTEVFCSILSSTLPKVNLEK